MNMFGPNIPSDRINEMAHDIGGKYPELKDILEAVINYLDEQWSHEMNKKIMNSDPRKIS